MRKLSILIILSIFSNLSYGQNEKDIIIGKRFTIKSEILNSDREISVYLPNSYYDNNYINYPVLYLLDGRKFFNSFSGVITQLSSDASPQIPEMIVIGITSQNRVKDSSPTNSLIGYTKEKEKGLEVSGGADDFLEFIQKELIPFVEKNYRTNSYRTFVGYSFTGLPVLQALFSIPETFNSYLVIDFSAWWDNEIMIQRFKKFSKEYKESKRDIFFTTVDRVSNNVYPEAYNAGWNFIQEFEQNTPSNITFDYKKYKYKEENHHSMPLISFIDGMKYIFRGHMINYDEMYTNPKLIKTKFSKLSQRLGYNVYLPEGIINYYGYLFLYTRPDIEKAIFYFNYNTKNYPLSSNTWSSLAEAYKVKGNKMKAIKFYNIALELNPMNTEIRKKSEELKN
ncbi:alpha/beta hydrolase-fold protein [Maribacter antarcticus]|uniref:alpha/beta hydrolase-fold protein n=1 Tax=Maribacter antarcticus TaxID=505250 RepID=UPI00047D2D84|nr:alpha/beta hydrolase-fold protein [Maribacter antarcticus]